MSESKQNSLAVKSKRSSGVSVTTSVSTPPLAKGDEKRKKKRNRRKKTGIPSSIADFRSFRNIAAKSESKAENAYLACLANPWEFGPVKLTGGENTLLLTLYYSGSLTLNADGSGSIMSWPSLRYPLFVGNAAFLTAPTVAGSSLSILEPSGATGIYNNYGSYRPIASALRARLIAASTADQGSMSLIQYPKSVLASTTTTGFSTSNLVNSSYSLKTDNARLEGMVTYLPGDNDDLVFKTPLATTDTSTPGCAIGFYNCAASAKVEYEYVVHFEVQAFVTTVPWVENGLWTLNDLVVGLPDMVMKYVHQADLGSYFGDWNSVVGATSSLAVGAVAGYRHYRRNNNRPVAYVGGTPVPLHLLQPVNSIIRYLQDTVDKNTFDELQQKAHSHLRGEREETEEKHGLHPNSPANATSRSSNLGSPMTFLSRIPVLKLPKSGK